MNKIKNVASSTKRFVYDHKVGIAVITTAAVCLTINRSALTAHDNFLKEKGLFDEFYTPEA